MWKMEAVKCQDVRRSLPPFVEGQLALTEWAIIQGHLLDCAECRKEVDRQRALAAGRTRASHRRATVATLVLHLSGELARDPVVGYAGSATDRHPDPTGYRGGESRRAGPGSGPAALPAGRHCRPR